MDMLFGMQTPSTYSAAMDVTNPAADSANFSFEDELAEAMAQLLQGAITPGEAVMAFEAACKRWAQLLREEASQHVHRPARYMNLKKQAADMEAQQATWRLLLCLFCTDQPPAGDGGPDLPALGGFRTYRQQITNEVVNDEHLSRCARVVAWLESLAADTLGQDGQRFAGSDGVWAETRMRAGQDNLVSELDPDAPGRQGKALHPDNARSEERLMQRLWQLVRAGRLKEARNLCRQCGQPWRAATLGGCGDFGPLPVGQAAINASLELDAEVLVQAEDVASEVDNGSGTLRALWKWTCHQTAQATLQSMSGSKYEAAVYGALAGDVAAILPVCSAWQDACWAYCRVWLDLRTDQLCKIQPTPANDLIAGDAVMAALLRCGVSTGSTGSVRSTLEGAMSVVTQGAWPPATLLHGGGASGLPQLPSSFPHIFKALEASPHAAVAVASQEHVAQVQQLVIQQAMAGLTSHLYSWLIQPQREAGANGSSGLSSGAAMGQAGDTATQTQWATFAAHLVLALEALGVLQETAEQPNGGEEQLWAQQANVSNQSEQVRGLYVLTLLERQSTWRLVPQYLSHLQPEGRATLGERLLEQLGRSVTDALAAGDEEAAAQADHECFEAHKALLQWFALCNERQQARDDALEPPDALETTIRRDELRQLLMGYVGRCRGAHDYSPLRRVGALRWLFYIFRESSDMPEALPSAYADALFTACALSTELAVGDGVTVAAAHSLLNQVVPPGFESAAAAVAEALRQQAVEAADSEEGGVAEACDQADELDDLAAELSDWRIYFQCRLELSDWQAAHAAAAGGTLLGGNAELVQVGAGLLQTLYDRLLMGDWQAGALSSCKAALSAAARSGTPGIELQVVLTGRPVRDDAGGGAAEAVSSAWSGPGCLFPTLAGPALFEAEAGLQAALAAAIQEGSSTLGRLHYEVAAPGKAQGMLLLTLSCAEDPQEWQALVSLASTVVAGSLPGQPQLLVTNMRADRATSLAVARRCCLAQVVLDGFRLRYTLVELGWDADTGPDLVQLLAGAAGKTRSLIGSHDVELLNELPTAVLKEALRLDAETQLIALRHAQQSQ